MGTIIDVLKVIFSLAQLIKQIIWNYYHRPDASFSDAKIFTKVLSSVEIYRAAKFKSFFMGRTRNKLCYHPQIGDLISLTNLVAQPNLSVFSQH